MEAPGRFFKGRFMFGFSFLKMVMLSPQLVVPVNFPKGNGNSNIINLG
jgi:hypothetical protein